MTEVSSAKRIALAELRNFIAFVLDRAEIDRLAGLDMDTGVARERIALVTCVVARMKTVITVAGYEPDQVTDEEIEEMLKTVARIEKRADGKKLKLVR